MNKQTVKKRWCLRASAETIQTANDAATLAGVSTSEYLEALVARKESRRPAADFAGLAAAANRLELFLSDNAFYQLASEEIAAELGLIRAELSRLFVAGRPWYDAEVDGLSAKPGEDDAK